MSVLKAIGGFFVKAWHSIVGFVKFVGPWKILGIVGSAISAAIPIICFAKKAIDHKKNNGHKAPQNITEMALTTKQERDNADPELRRRYDNLVEDSARSLLGKKPKNRKKKVDKNNELKKLLQFNNNMVAPRRNVRHMSTEELVKSDPAWRQWAMQKRVPAT